MLTNTIRSDIVDKDIYDWVEQYDANVASVTNFISKYTSQRYFADKQLPMDISDMTKYAIEMNTTYDVANRSVNVCEENNPDYIVAAENYEKNKKGNFKKWLKENSEEHVRFKAKSDRMASKTYRRLFSMGVIVQNDNISLLEKGLNSGERSVAESMYGSRKNVHGIQGHFIIVIDRIIQLVLSLGLKRCYINLYNNQWS